MGKNLNMYICTQDRAWQPVHGHEKKLIITILPVIHKDEKRIILNQQFQVTDHDYYR